jgi:hypothetical protein
LQFHLAVLGVREDLSDKNFALSKFDFRDDAQFVSTHIENVLIADLIDAGKRRLQLGEVLERTRLRDSIPSV